MKLIIALVLFSSSFVNAQMDTFRVEIEPLEIVNSPAVHSGALAVYNGKWIYIGGRINGLHGFLSPFAFPSDGKNENVFVIDPVLNQVWSSSLTLLPENLYDPLTSSNIPFCQDENALYMAGGYGWSNSANDFKTFPVLTRVDLACIHDAVINGSDLNGCFRQTTDSVFAITGGHLEKTDDVLSLVFGHRFDGIYSVLNPGNSVHVQTYSNEIRTFQLEDDGINLSIEGYQAIRDTVNFHRRDYNLIPQIFPDRSYGFTAFSGVFQYNSLLPYLSTVNIKNGEAELINGFDQHLSQYHSAVMPVYDSLNNVMHSFFFGGMSRFSIDTTTGEMVDDTLVPFVKTISSVSRFGDGTLEENQLDIRFQDFLGTNMEFIRASDAPVLHNKIIDVNKITADRTLAGYLFGGIKSPNPNISSTDPGSSEANSKVYAVYLSRATEDTGTVGNEKFISNLPLNAFSCYPNPATTIVTLEFELNKPGKVELAAFTRRGELIALIGNKEFPAGKNILSWSTSGIAAGTYHVRAKMKNSTKTISVIIKP